MRERLCACHLLGRLRLADTLGWDLETMIKGRVERTEENLRLGESSAGIVVTDCQGDSSDGGGHPRIAAFIWGGKVPPTPTLPFGRWKGAA